MLDEKREATRGRIVPQTVFDTANGAQLLNAGKT
jgi:hypothetical protein